MASSVAATELAREGLTLLLLHVPQHTVLGVDTQVFWVGPRFRGIKMVPPGPHLVHYCSPAGTGMSSHLQLDSFLLLTCLRWSFEDGIFKRSLDHTLWILLETGNNFQVTCHGVSVNSLSQLDEKLKLHWRHHGWMDRAPQTDMERRLMDNLEKTNLQRKLPHSLSGEDATTQLSLLQLSTRTFLQMS